MAMGALDKDMKNMGTTVVMAIWRKGPELFIAGVGDSRAYLVRKGKIQQLTTDHSLAQALVEARTISPAEAKDHRFRNVLWKYLGSKEVGEGPEVSVVPIGHGDKFLLCSTASRAWSRTINWRPTSPSRPMLRPAPTASASWPSTRARATTSRAS